MDSSRSFARHGAEICIGVRQNAIWHTNQVISRVRSGGYGYTIGKNIALCYVPVELARVGEILHVEIFGERVPAVVAREPLYDPKGDKLRA